MGNEGTAGGTMAEAAPLPSVDADSERNHADVSAAISADASTSDRIDAFADREGVDASGVVDAVSGVDATADVVDAAVDPRFRIVEPLSPPPVIYVKGFLGDLTKRDPVELLPTDVVMAFTDVLAANDDVSVLVGTSSYAIARPSLGDVWRTSRSFRWTATEGTVAIGELPGTVESYPVLVSADASIVYGHARNPDGTTRLYRWTKTSGAVDLGGPPGGLSPSWDNPDTGQQLRQISADGKLVIAFATFDDGTKGVTWSESSGWDVLPAHASAKGINDTGNTVLLGLLGFPYPWPSDMWWQRGLAPLPLSANNGCWGSMMSADGQVVHGDCTDGMNSSSFRWSHASGAMTTFDAQGQLRDISRDGSVVLLSQFQDLPLGGSGAVPYRWTQAGGSIPIAIQTGEDDPMQLAADGRMVLGVWTVETGGSGVFSWTAPGTLIQYFIPSGYVSTCLRGASSNAAWLTGEAQNHEVRCSEATEFDGRQGELLLFPDTDPAAMAWNGTQAHNIAQELVAEGVDLRGLVLRMAKFASSGPTIRIAGGGTYPSPMFPRYNLHARRAWVATL